MVVLVQGENFYLREHGGCELECACWPLFSFFLVNSFKRLVLVNVGGGKLNPLFTKYKVRIYTGVYRSLYKSFGSCLSQLILA